MGVTDELEVSLQQIYDRDRDKELGKWNDFAAEFVKLNGALPDNLLTLMDKVVELANKMSLAENGVADKRAIERKMSKAFSLLRSKETPV